MKSLHILAAAGVLTLTCLCSFAEDFTTLDGQTFTNISEVVKYPKLIVFTCNGARISAANTNLPEDFKSKHGIQASINSAALKAAPAKSGAPGGSAVDLFLFQNKDSDLMECESIEIKTNGVETGWQICLDEGVRVTLTRYETELDVNKFAHSMPVYFQIGQETMFNQAFDKFLEWDALAVKNNAEPFEKVIANYKDLTQIPGMDDTINSIIFHWDSGMSSVLIYFNTFNKDDVIHFQEVLKRIPELKEKLAAKIRNKNTQKDLFK